MPPAGSESSINDFSKELVDGQLEKIFAAPLFKSSGILIRFLTFIVTETMAGRSHTIKEYTIGVNVLDMPADFKPQLNGIVRIHAGRLRRALHNYYKLSGNEQQLVIFIPKGSYVPEFQLPLNGQQQDSEEKNTGDFNVNASIIVAVMPFRHIEDNPSRVSFADGLGEYLSQELSRFQDISVIAYYTMRQMPAKISGVKDLESSLGAQYVISGTLQFQGEQLRATVQLINVSANEQLWSKTYERHFSVEGLFEIQDDIVSQVISELGDYCGLIVRHKAKASGIKKTKELSVYNAILWFYHFHSEFTADAFKKALTAMEAAVKKESDYAMAWAALCDLYSNSYLFNHVIAEEPFQLGLKCAQRAVQLDPQCQVGYVTLALAHTYQRNRTEAQNAIDKAISLNPNSITLVGMVGFLMICMGEHERGFELMERSIRLNRFYPPWFNAGIAFYYIMHKDFEQAYYWADRMNLPGIGWDHLICAAVLGHLKKPEQAKERIAQLFKTVPHFSSHAKKYIDLLMLNEELLSLLTEGLHLAGFPALDKKK